MLRRAVGVGRRRGWVIGVGGRGGDGWLGGQREGLQGGGVGGGGGKEPRQVQQGGDVDGRQGRRWREVGGGSYADQISHTAPDGCGDASRRLHEGAAELEPSIEGGGADVQTRGAQAREDLALDGQRVLDEADEDVQRIADDVVLGLQEDGQLVGVLGQNVADGVAQRLTGTDDLSDDARLDARHLCGRGAGVSRAPGYTCIY